MDDLNLCFDAEGCGVFSTAVQGPIVDIRQSDGTTRVEVSQD